ncbi:MAG TPA: GTP 3',8-cyclase MoaA [Candidatus Limnocylindrales bacterium]|nr:GTP 3',8-cyclase MoaA [Candidatus Limnocylindrales bacterium]
MSVHLENSRTIDRLGRPIHDLRISVTDRCNFRCTYCMPREVYGRDFAFLPRAELLTFEEIERLARVFVGLGVKKLRLTGGEPLLRRDLPVLVEMLAAIDGVEDITLTTNGSLLTRHVTALARAGLSRISVSLDSLDDGTFARMNDVGFPVATVLDGIAAAADAGLTPIKVNMVVRRGINEDDVVPMARYFRERGHILRFIEYMDVGHTNGWRMDDVVPAAAIVARIDEEMPLVALAPQYPGEVADRWAYRDGGGEVGVIASVTEPFCADCSRARITADGQLYTCLFSSTGHDLRALLRSGATDADLSTAMSVVWGARDDRYSEQRTLATGSGRELPVIDPTRVEMSRIGG